MAELASPTAKVTAAITMALAASTRPRLGVAANVTRIRPRRYSAVMNVAPTAATAISPANTPIRVCAIVTPSPDAPDTDGAMSPVPVTVSRPAASVNPPGDPAAGPPGAPMALPSQAPPGQAPRRLAWSKVPVAWLLPMFSASWPIDSCVYGGEVANSPPCTVVGRPVRVAAATFAQWMPSSESYPVSVSPDRVSRSQRGDAAETEPAMPG